MNKSGGVRQLLLLFVEAASGKSETEKQFVWRFHSNYAILS